MQIIIDTREHDMLSFRKECNPIRECLKVGDYSCRIDGNLIPVSFERKNVSDLFGTLSGGYDRFKKEINRSAELGIMLILAVECPLSEVRRGIKHSKRDPSSLIKQCFTLMVRHKVPCMFFSDRRDMAEYITQVFFAFERELNEKEKSSRKTKKDQSRATFPVDTQ